MTRKMKEVDERVIRERLEGRKAELERKIWNIRVVTDILDKDPEVMTALEQLSVLRILESDDDVWRD